MAATMLDSSRFLTGCQPPFAFGLRLSDLPGFYNQQHDSPDQREHADDRRDKVAVGGFDVQAEKINWLAGGRECNARVSEHHDAQGDQDDGYYSFWVHIESPVFLFRLPVS
jgi:hypothetical protein